MLWPKREREGKKTNELQTRRIPRHVWPHLAVMLLAQLLVFYPTAVWLLSESKAYARRMVKGYLIAMLLSCVIFLAYPTTLTRPVPPDSGFFNVLLAQLYQIDDPVHLLPSLHVLITYFCIRAAMGSRIIPRWYFPFAVVFLLLVCLCILFVKQHVLADIPSAIVVGELSVQLAGLGKERE